MSTYKNLIGKDVNFLTTDPDNAQAEGQIWYNSTSNVFKDLIVGEAWSAGGSLGTGRYAMSAGTGGTADSAIAVFGRTTAATEEYNGTGWAVGGTGGTARYSGAKFGTQTAEVAAGGKATGTNFQNVEEYNGSSWSEVNNYTGTARGYLSGFGILTAGVICGGVSASPDTWYNLTEEYDGTNWTTGGTMNNARATAGTTGILTAGLVFGGYQPTLLAKAEEYNGTAWTQSGDMNTARSHLAGSGTQDVALAFGGLTPPRTTQTESYDGSTWSISGATLSTPTARHSSAGSAASTGLSFGGNPPGTPVTEEYNKSINIITGGAWASGGTMGTARYTAGDCGVYNAGLVFGGNPSSAPYTSNATEEYGGTSWTAGGNVPHATSDLSGAGTQTAALCFGFSDSPATLTATYDGSSWTTIPATLPGPAGQGRGIGTQTAALLCGFATPGTTSLEYDGSSWTSGGSLNNERSAQKPGGWGIQTAAVLASGPGPTTSTLISNTESYDGSSWTETGHSVVSARKRVAVTTAAPSSNGMLMGGGDNAGTNAATNTVQIYNGTTWVTQANLATARINPAGFGTSTNAVVAGGGPPVTAATEEFTGETSALNINTITTS